MKMSLRIKTKKKGMETYVKICPENEDQCQSEKKNEFN